MTFTPSRDDAARARFAIADFHTAGITLPDEVTELTDRLTRLANSRPQPPAPNAVARLIADEAAPDTVAAAAAAHLAATHLRDQHRQAEDIVGARLLAAIRDHRDTVHSEMLPAAQTAIDALRGAAALDPELTLTAAVRDGRRDDAELLASVTVNFDRWQQLRDLRAAYLVHPGERLDPGGWDATIWRDERPAIAHTSAGRDALASFRDALNAGAEPWFGSIDEIIAAAGNILANEQHLARTKATQTALTAG